VECRDDREGTALIERALATAGRPYCIQAAIGAVHAAAPTMAETDWGEITALYDVLLVSNRHPSSN
jgi:RNA polymerase sigma-70 factor (ECF subfamily)